MNEYVSVEIEPVGMGAFEHNLNCWHCNEKPAVYSAHPNWHFIPCWSCQTKYQGSWTKKKSWWQKLKALQNKK